MLMLSLLFQVVHQPPYALTLDQQLVLDVYSLCCLLTCFLPILCYTTSQALISLLDVIKSALYVN